MEVESPNLMPSTFSQPLLLTIDSPIWISEEIMWNYIYIIYVYMYKIIVIITLFVKKCEICSKLTINAPERLSTIFIVNFGHISHLFSVSAVAFEQVNVWWLPPYQLINTETTYCCNYWQMYKNHSEIAAHKKRLWSKIE